MDQVYSMLTSEQKRLTEKRKLLATLQDTKLPSLVAEFTKLKEAHQELRRQVKGAVDQEVKQLF